MDQERTNLFNKYLFLGGIDASPRQFTGMANDQETITEADADHIRAITATDFVGGSGGRFYDNSDSENWEVDFEAVVKGFLSRTMTDLYMYDVRANETAADLIKNFLNYVLMHDVCPEYVENVMAARHVCDIAPTELRYMHELTAELPGSFNRAARSLFCEGNVNHLDQDANFEMLVLFRLTALLWPLGQKVKQAREKILEAEDPTTIRVVSTTEETYRVVEIERPRRKDIKAVEEQLEAMKQGRKLKPAGVIRVLPTVFEHGWGNMPRSDEMNFDDAEEEEIVLEDELLGKFEVGMKLRMTVCELNVGLRFIKDVHELRVSFDTFLPQNLMSNWREPVANERPPPSIHSSIDGPVAPDEEMEGEV
ncbi:Argonaute complex, subunit Arb1 [Poronia punctata]|nr:Argonaute complex, subunit Arb1 [Poronia punctata]